MPQNKEQDSYDLWASGAKIANGDFFEEIPTELEKPANFQVNPDQIPSDPTKPEPTPVQTVTVPETVPVTPPTVDPDQEVVQLPSGGTVTIEKTSRGWKAILDSGDSAKPAEHFYGNNKTQL